MVPQLPPQMFTTAASLLDLTDSKITMLKGRWCLGEDAMKMSLSMERRND